MKNFAFVILLLFSVCYATAADFDRVLDMVVENNLALKYAESKNSAELASLKAESTLDAPELNFENLWGAKGIGDKRNFSVSQGFDWPGIYAARREAISRSHTAMQFLHESAVLETRQQVRLLLIDIIYTRQKIAASEKICESFASLSRSFKKAVDEGNETRLDYNKAVIERINAERELKTLKGDYETMLSSLRILNGGKDVENLVESLGDLYPEVDLSMLRPDLSTLRAKDPAIAARQAETEVQKSLVKVEKRSLLPGFTLSYNHEWEMGDRFNGFSVSVSLPFLTGRKKVKAALLNSQTAEMQQEMELISLSASMHGDYERALQLKELLDKYNGVMNDNASFDLLKKAFEGGEINFLTYIQELNFFLGARKDFLDTLYDYHQTVARLQKYD